MKNKECIHDGCNNEAFSLVGSCLACHGRVIEEIRLAKEIGDVEIPLSLEISSIKITQDNVVLLRGDWDFESMKTLQERLSKMNLNGLLCVLADGLEIEALGEEEMAKYGWVRA